MKIFFLTFLLIASSSFTHGIQVSDATFLESLPAEQSRPELTLNGAALRELYLLVESYAGALYLERTSKDAEAIINSVQNKKMIFEVLLKKVSARRLSNALQEALVLNISKEQHNQLQPSIEQMLSYFKGNLHFGDRVEFNYTPDIGTEIVISGKPQGIITDTAFFQSLLKVWIGEYPVSRDFKASILGAIDF